MNLLIDCGGGLRLRLRLSNTVRELELSAQISLVVVVSACAIWIYRIAGRCDVRRMQKRGDLVTLAFQPMLRYYGLSALRAPTHPAIAIADMVFTVNSALQYSQGRGGMWNGRAQAQVSSF